MALGLSLAIKSRIIVPKAQQTGEKGKIIGERVGKGGKGGRRAKADAYFGCLG